MEEKTKLNMQMYDAESILAPLQKLNLMDDFLFDAGVDRALIDFLHYVEKSSEENVPEDCDERLKHLHKKIHQIKMSEEIGVSYMKMEERDRLIRAEGRAEGEARLVGVIRKKVSKNMSAADIADWLETGREEVERTIELLGAHPDWTDLQVAEELLGRGNLAKFDA